VALDPPNIVAVSIDEALSHPRRVALDSDTLATAREIGISFGD
jgi:ATP-dependent phosphofructokinase / diphosphate-dependent phosphofructokinase